jgi:uncharacterized protein (UPF0303 family)
MLNTASNSSYPVITNDGSGMDDHVTDNELRRVREQSSLRSVARFTHADAIDVGQAALRIADGRDLPVVIDVRRGHHVVFHAARAGTTAEHDDWVRRKVNTAVRHEIPSYEFLLRQRQSGRVPDWLDPTEFAVAGGAVPVIVSGSVAGTVTVSGITTSPHGDHDLAMEALASAFGTTPNP